jgi:Na+/H+-dicarboxylate symporter
MILVAMVLGLAAGGFTHEYLATDQIKEVGAYLSMITAIFLRLIKMIIAPLVFCTVVSGIAGMGDGKAVGRIGLRALGWFVCASLISLCIGLIMASVLQPGAGMHVATPTAETASGLKVNALDVKIFLTQIFPTSIFDAMTSNNILQILVFAIFLGFALASHSGKKAETAITLLEEMVHVMLRVTNLVMFFAPVGVFAAVGSAVALNGFEIIVTYGKYMGSFYLALAVLWVVLILAGGAFLKGSVFRLVKLVRAPMILGFCTASSEAAYPITMQALEKFGVKNRIVSFMLPLGYSFNLDGSMINMTFASLFIAQIYGVDMSVAQKITMLLVLMISSKGIAGVPRASLVVVAAVLPIFHIPEAGVLLVMGIDQFLDMGRTATNVLGNCIATSVIAKWEGALSADGISSDEEFEESGEQVGALETTA